MLARPRHSLALAIALVIPGSIPLIPVHAQINLGEPQPLETAISDVTQLEPDSGPAIAARVRNAVPEEPVQFTGELKIRRRGESIQRVPMRFEILLDGPVWKTIYESEAAPDQPAERWTIVHTPGQPNQYWRTVKSPECGTWSDPERLEAPPASAAFAGSDFALIDLAMEFLHWPGQELVRTQMRKGRVCKVLESTPAQPDATGYARVVSWLDKETGGPVLAEAYDAENKRLKEFSVGDFRKVDGRWMLEDMKIDNVQTRSRTWIEYDLK